MQLRRPTWFVFGVGISNCCRILWTARTLHKASEAISLFSNPFFNNVSIKICCAASSCGAMIADTKALALEGIGKTERTDRRTDGAGWWGKLPILPLPWDDMVPWCTAGAEVHSHKCQEMDPAKNN
jgi:hypothetical protein